VRGHIREAQARKVSPLRNPGLWVALLGLALIVDMTHRTNFLAVGTRLRGWMEPGKEFARQLEGWIGLVCVFVGVWFYAARSKRDPSE
jgi:hypothetical protein